MRYNADSEKGLLLFRTLLKKTRIMTALLGMPRLAYFVLRYIMRPLAFKKWTRLNDPFRMTFIHLGGGRTPVEDIPAYKHAFKARVESMEKIISQAENEKPILWIQWSLSRILLRGFDVAAINLESLVRLGYAIRQEDGFEFLDEAAREGIVPEGCSSQRSAMGAILLERVPFPAAIIATSHPCDSGVSIYQNMEYLTDVPVFMYDSPSTRDDAAIKHYARQSRELISFLEARLGQKFNWEKFKSAIKNYNEYSRYSFEISEMCKAKPCPVYPISLMNIWELRTAATGTEYPAKFTEIIYRNARRRLELKKGIVPKEKIRILWWDMQMGWTDLQPWLEEEFGAVVIADYLSYNVPLEIDTSTEDAMLEGAAKIDLLYGMTRQTAGPSEFITDEFYALVDEFSPDCIVVLRHAGCKHAWAFTKILKEICQKTGLPNMLLDVDVFDPRESSEEDIKRQLTEFFKSHGLA